MRTRRLLDAAGHKLTWFRHPYTHTGPTAEIKALLDAFLNEHAYEVAPFTIEVVDYAFAVVYERALMAGADAKAEETMAADLAHTDVMLAFAEALALDTFGRDIPQVLLAHVNRLNADAMPELLRRLRARGYIFVTLDGCLTTRPTTRPTDSSAATARRGLHRWRVALGQPSRMAAEPHLLSWVTKAVE